ncbi:M4 family metallopeptidase [Plantibacter flavus]|uniref:M4 family metallopeptidase n=1 Tax=Plantibacter flavus TaxID=150123 RepID=UPI003F188FE7
MNGSRNPSPSALTPASQHVCGIVPPWLLERIAELDSPQMARAANAARYSLLATRPYRFPEPGAEPRTVTGSVPAVRAGDAVPGPPERSIFDAERTETLPGVLVRSEGEPTTSDDAVTAAYDGLGDTHALFAEAFGRDSIDGRGLPLLATVHYGDDYDNAFWNGERMVFGDGDGEVFRNFTSSLSVIGHELAHGVTQYTANLAYEGQSGALNEHVSDVFGALVEQHARGQDAANASWLIGEGLFTDEVEGNALRSMLAPGTAYDDDVLGRDPQPAHLDDYIETTDDNGGVHLNSGIPNRAFATLAVALGGNAWERAGQIWYDTLTSGLSDRTDFATFAAATITAAAKRFGDASPEVRAVSEAWTLVGIAPAR